MTHRTASALVVTPLAAITVVLSSVGAVAAAGAASAAGSPASVSIPSISTPSISTASTGTVYIVQGVDATTMAISVDGKQVNGAAPAKTIVGPLHLSSGKHTVTSRDDKGSTIVTASFTVRKGVSMDAVVHRQADATATPVFTTYTNDLSPVTSGSGRLVVAHTAAVGPADVRVKGKVLFANIASGESLTLTVPKGTYPVDIVPTATSGPAVLGPVKLPVAATALTRVFAIGVAATKSMDAVVQVLPLSSRGSGTAPSKVNAGDGGQAATMIQRFDPASLSAQAAPASTGSARSHTGTSAAGTSAAGLLLVGATVIGLRRRHAAQAGTR